MPPINLTDEELDAVVSAALPIAVDRRDAFLRQVANALAGCVEIGPGTVHRICAATERAFFDPPLETRSGAGSTADPASFLAAVRGSMQGRANQGPRIT
jgi:hypothetical protein